MSDSPNYFSIIPASVRYDNNISPNAKLLYSELTALTKKDGYCYASNGYFSNLYKVDSRTIRRWVSELVRHGHVRLSLTSNNTIRHIFIVEYTSSYPGQKCPTPRTKMSDTQDKNVLLNNTSNNTSNNLELPFSSKAFQETWNDWDIHRRQKKQKLTPKSIELQFKKMKEWGEEKSIHIINYAIEKGWTGLYEPKEMKETVSKLPKARKV